MKIINGTLFLISIAVSAPVLADSYCPQTIDCTVSGGSATCNNLPDGWIMTGVAYRGKTPPEITLSLFIEKTLAVDETKIGA